MGRIETRLSELEQAKKKALVYFVTTGFPRLDSTPSIANALERGGADILELGMPFSDPLADGPVIQHSSTIALKNGVTLETVLGAVSAIRKKSGIPLVLMGYLNPIVEYGPEKFFSEASSAGVDGIILPELPVEEVGRFKPTIDSNNLSQILLVTPTTSQDRIRQIDAASSGFLYCVSTTGVTGSSHSNDIGGYLKRVRQEVTRNRLLVGFGISTPADAAAIARFSDGIIIGSALIRELEKNPSPDDLTEWVRQFRKALDTAV